MAELIALYQNHNQQRNGNTAMSSLQQAAHTAARYWKTNGAVIVAGRPTRAGVMVFNCQACWVALEFPQAGLSMPVMPLIAADSTVPFA
ncbi:hypothetical protein [Delftia acidovorans]|uniref:hypothetical protein n=1 Tax=Delftia acidovorans TaxID=80866 RepID=UPI00301917FC